MTAKMFDLYLAVLRFLAEEYEREFPGAGFAILTMISDFEQPLRDALMDVFDGDAGSTLAR